MDLAVRLQQLDGVWVRCGHGRYPGVYPQSVQVTADKWGFASASFQLRRDPQLIQPDLQAFTPCEIDHGPYRIFEGRVKETPTSDQPGDKVINVSGEGWQYHLDDDVLEQLYVHNSLADWKDARAHINTNLASYKTAGQVETGQGRIMIGWPDNTTIRNPENVGVMLDLPQAHVKRGVFTVTTTANSTSIFLQIIGYEVPFASPGQVLYNQSLTTTGVGPVTISGTFTSPCAMVYIILAYSGAVTTTSQDAHVAVTSAKLFSDTAFESGGNSILKASDIVKDVLPIAPLLSQDVSNVAATAFDIPAFATSEPRTPRELIESADAFHLQRKMVRRDRIVVYEPYPTAAKYVLGARGGHAFDDASANASEDIYSKVVITGTQADGTALRVVRRTSQLPGVQLEELNVFTNPSFDVDTSGWAPPGGFTTGVARTTTAGEFDSAPAGAEFTSTGSGQQQVATTLQGLFLAGVTYEIHFWIKSSSSLTGGVVGAGAQLVGTPPAQVPPEGYFNTKQNQQVLRWTPSVDQTNPILLIYFLAGVTNVWVDSFKCFVARPTIVDKRGFTRAHVKPATAAMEEVAAVKIADAFLVAHMRTPLRGSLRVGPGDLYEATSGRPVHPAELVEQVGELIHFAHLVDPDTGGQGRDGLIAGIGGYDPDDLQASVTIDSSRDNLEAVLSRYAVVAGG